MVVKVIGSVWGWGGVGCSGGECYVGGMVALVIG